MPFVTQALKDAPGVLVAASDYMKVLPESIAQWLPRPLVALGTDGFGRSESRAALRDFFEVDAKHIVLATLTALAREKQIKLDVLQKAVKDLGNQSGKSESGKYLNSSAGEMPALRRMWARASRSCGDRHAPHERDARATSKCQE